ncbi:MAG: autotransporter-associated beta strand repeat-containing protein [Thermoguttaceae bacterium]
MRPTGWVLLAALICGSAVADDMQRGCNLPLFNSSINLTQLAQSLAEFKADGGQYVAVNVWWFQDNINSTVIQPNYSLYSVTDTTVTNTIAAIQAQGLQAVLKPLVDLSNDSSHWRGQIAGGSTWFNGTNGYDSFLEHYAGIAAQNNVAMFVVGTELSATNGQTSNWTTAISDVRAAGYTGKLTYAANWGSGSSVIESPVAWWGSLDYIGIDAYYPLSGTTLAQLNSAWASQASTINTWWNALPAAQQKPVLFTEVGYVNNAPDPQTQANSYQALLLNLWGNEPWFKGTYWWDWTPATPPLNYDNFIFQGKPAEQVMKAYYCTPGSWSAAPADGAWQHTANWSGGPPPGASDGSTVSRHTALFNAASSTTTIIPDANRNVQNITFDTAAASAYTIGTTGGNALLLSDGGTVQTTAAVANPQKVNAPLVLENAVSSANGVYTFTSGAAGGTATLSFGGAIQGAATAGTTLLTLSGANSGANTIGGNISNGTGGGNLAVTKAGAGTWVLSGSNTYSGGTTVSNGLLVINRSAALPTGSILSIGASGSVELGDSTLNGSAIPLGNSGPAGTLASQGAAADGIHAVPEPGTLVLLAAAATCGLAVWRRKKGLRIRDWSFAAN